LQVLFFGGTENYAKAAYYNSYVVKLENDPTVYLVQNSKYKIAIPNEKIFHSYGFKWQDVKIVSLQELQNYSDTVYIRLVNSKNLYRLETNGQKRLLSQAAQNFLKLSSESSMVVSRVHLTYFKTGELITKSELEKTATILKPLNLNSAVSESLATTTQSSLEKCVPSEQVGGENGCKVYEAYIKNNVALCGEIQDLKWQSICYSSFIPESGDSLANCKKISSSDYLYDCYAAVATVKKDSGICSQIPLANKKNLCLMNVGIALKDFSACNYAEDAKKDSCYFSYAIINLKPEACDKISATSEYKTNCVKFSKK
jgi:hypothetical protein